MTAWILTGLFPSSANYNLSWDTWEMFRQIWLQSKTIHLLSLTVTQPNECSKSLDYSQYAYSILSLLAFIIFDNHDTSHLVYTKSSLTEPDCCWMSQKQIVSSVQKQDHAYIQRSDFHIWDIVRVQYKTSVFFSDQLYNKMVSIMMIKLYQWPLLESPFAYKNGQVFYILMSNWCKNDCTN